MSQPCIDAALSAALPGETVEVWIESARTSKVTVVEGEVESSEEEVDIGAGLRFWQEGRVGFAYTATVTPEAVVEAVAAARSLARHSRADPSRRPPDAGPPIRSAAGPTAPDRAVDGHLSRVERARRVETAARAASADRCRTRSSIACDAEGWVEVAHSGGLAAAWSWVRSWLNIEVVAERDGQRQTGFESDWAPRADRLDTERVGKVAAARALGRFGARPMPTARMNVVLDPMVAAGLFETLAEALCGKAILRGRSLFVGRVGEVIASPAVTLVDDPTRPGGYDDAPADGEGVPSRRAVLVEQGVLRGFLHDTWTGTALDGAPGHAVRGGFAEPPLAGPRNLYLEPSGLSREQLLKSVPSGLYVEEFMGLHTVDPVTGDFSLGAVGHALRGGSLAEPVAGVTVSGNVSSLLRAIEAVADDLRFFSGGGGGSTILLRDLTVGGV